MTNVFSLKLVVGQYTATPIVILSRPNFDLPNPFISFQNLSLLFNCGSLASAVSRAGPRNEMGHLAHSHKRFKQVPGASAYGIQMGTKTCATVH